MSRNPHQLLGVLRTASLAEIKRAYRRLARELHPDRNPDPAAAERLKQINAAYAQLTADPARREPPPSATEHTPVSQSKRTARDPLHETLDGIVGTPSEQRPTARGSDLLIRASVTLLESIQGANRRLTVNGYLRCRTCNGRGVGCPGCNGEGRQIGERELEIPIPTGVVDGTRLRLPGEGAAGRRGAPAGDLFLTLDLLLPAGWTRTARDLVAPLSLGALRAALGGRISLALPEGRITLTVPAGTVHGDTIRVPGRGLPALRGSRRGDLLLTVAISTPRPRRPAARAALRAALDAGADGETAIGE